MPDLRALQRALIDLALPGRAAVIVPTRNAAVELRRTLENVVQVRPGSAALRLPDLLTRVDFYSHLAQRLPDAPPLLTEFEREVLFRLAARTAERAGVMAPFRLRPGLIGEMLGFYDELRRNDRTVDDFARLVSGDLAASAETDRGAERLWRQAEFLAATFAEFERRVASAGRIDEHGLRTLLLERPVEPACQHVVVAVADRAADPHGLCTADFDLLARLPGTLRIDVVATERLLAAGFHQRLHEHHLPGIEDTVIGTASAPPVLLAPMPTRQDKPVVVHTYRDREEELVGVARSVKSHDFSHALDRTAVVFQRPLPYLYLARQVFGSAHIPYQAMDALPLAGEPFVAGLDLVFAFLSSEGTRASTVELLASPQWTFTDPDTAQTIERAHVSALDACLREGKYLGGWDRLLELTLRASGSAACALRAAAAAAQELDTALRGPRASEQLLALRQFILRHERPPRSTDPWHDRHFRARAAVLDALDGVHQAHGRHDDDPVPFTELAAAIRRWIEGQTFAPRTGTEGLLLLDAAAAAFATVDAVRIVGLVEGDWPEASSKSIFFPSKLLEPLGWPSPSDRLSAARARFQDLLRLPAEVVSASTVLLEDDGIVAPSAFTDEVSSAGLVLQHESGSDPQRIFDHEALSIEPVDGAGVTGEAAAWLSFRKQLPPTDRAQFHGEVGARPASAYAVSRVERYLECPFKYFAAHILRLDEERAEESGLTPQERGQFLHAVFESFFGEWSRSGRGAMTADTLEEALVLFEEVADGHLEKLREADRSLERTYLLGSAVAPGLAERAFAFEIEHGVGVVERLLEHGLEGSFVLAGPAGPQEVALKGKADRIDLLDDGTLRIVDYKIGRAPKPSRSLQLAVYGACARQQLGGRHGRDWQVSRAGYVAFKEKNAFVSLGVNLQKALAEGEQRFVAAVTSIEQGSFPPRPEDPWLCSRCGYAIVCRKDYVGDE